MKLENVSSSLCEAAVDDLVILRDCEQTDIIPFIQDEAGTWSPP